MYSLPPELERKIWQAIAVGIDTEVDYAKLIFDEVVALVVGENNRIRQQVVELMRDFAEIADRDDGDYGDIRAAAGGEFCCEHIINKIIKPGVHSNKKTEEQEDVVERIIQDFFEEDDD